MTHAYRTGARVSDPYDVLKAAENARIAIRRGDLNAAERWFRIADRAVAIAQRLRDMERPKERSRWTVERNPV